MVNHFLSAADLSRLEADTLLNRARALKAEWHGGGHPRDLPGPGAVDEALGFERVEQLRVPLIGSGHVVAERVQVARDRAHPRTADRDDVHGPRRHQIERRIERRIERDVVSVITHARTLPRSRRGSWPRRNRQRDHPASP